MSGAPGREERATTKLRQGDGPVLVVGDLGAVGRARRYVVERVVAHGLVELAADAELVASEVVTNALLHAGPPVELAVHVSPPRVRVEVTDRTRKTPVQLGGGGQAMTGRGLNLVEQLTRAWGVAPVDGGKTVWAELEAGATPPGGLDADALISLWADDPPRGTPAGEDLHTVRLGDVPTDLLLTAKSHVDDLVREFSLAASGASSGLTAEVPAHLAELIETVVYRFSEARETIRRQALVARQRGQSHVTLELHLPASAAHAGEEYLRALDEADAYSRAARLLTLESPPQHRVFRHWYVQELVTQLRRAAAGAEPVPSEPFEQRLLREIDRMAETERRVTRAARMYDLTAALAKATSPEAVVRTALYTGATALGASGGAVLLAAGSRRLAVPGTVGYDPDVVARLQDESSDAELPAATVLRTGEPVWVESPAERDARFPELAVLEPGTGSLVAVPIETGGTRLGALRFSFTQGRLFDEDERNFVMAIAAQTAQALDRARLAAARSDATRRLQRSLLPPALPDVEGITISTAYQPLTESLDIGGDFYDVWVRGPRRLALAIGDVCGHGPEAAAVSALVRHTLRALTMTSADAVAILRMLHDALRDALAGSDRFATVTFGFLTTGPEACRLLLVGGGHPGPTVVRESGSTEVLEVGGSLLGIIDDPRIGCRHISLKPDEEVVLVTDGVTDARDGRGAWFGHDGVARAVSGARAAGVDTAEAVSQAVVAHAGGRLHDDLAVLALRWDGP